MTNLTVVVLVKNEDEVVINRCLESVGFCSEIIMINDTSSHNSPLLPPLAGFEGQAKVKSYSRELGGDFASQRNFGMEKATNDWVLFVDADEQISKELQKEIKSEILNPKSESCYFIKRRDFFWGHEIKYGETAKARNKGIIRLVKKDSGKWIGKVHEEFKIQKSLLRQGFGGQANVKCLNGYLNHYPHQTVKEFIQSVNFYSSLRAEELYKQGKKTNILQIIFYPLLKFKLTYFLKLGFLDGAAGFAYSFFMSFHSFLVRIKLYQKTRINPIH